jgi:hypothetical protein
MSSTFRMSSAALILLVGFGGPASLAKAAAHNSGEDLTNTKDPKAGRPAMPLPSSPRVGACASGAKYWELPQHDNTLIIPCVDNEVNRHFG